MLFLTQTWEKLRNQRDVLSLSLSLSLSLGIPADFLRECFLVKYRARRDRSSLELCVPRGEEDTRGLHERPPSPCWESVPSKGQRLHVSIQKKTFLFFLVPPFVGIERSSYSPLSFLRPLFSYICFVLLSSALSLCGYLLPLGFRKR